MKKLLFLALLSSISVVTKSWLVLDNPPTIDDVVDGTIQEVQQSPILKESKLWEQIPLKRIIGQRIKLQKRTTPLLEKMTRVKRLTKK